MYTRFSTLSLAAEAHYMQFILLRIPAEHGDNKWFEIGGMVIMDLISKFQPTDDQLTNKMKCKLVLATREIISYHIDHAYMSGAAELMTYIPSGNFLYNSDFEIRYSR